MSERPEQEASDVATEPLSVELLAPIAAQLIAARGVQRRPANGLPPSGPVTDEFKEAALDAAELIRACAEVVDERIAMRKHATRVAEITAHTSFPNAIEEITGAERDSLKKFRDFMKDAKKSDDYAERIADWKKRGMPRFVLLKYKKDYQKWSADRISKVNSQNALARKKKSRKPA
jgi:hypothetical protein